VVENARVSLHSWLRINPRPDRAEGLFSPGMERYEGILELKIQVQHFGSAREDCEPEVGYTGDQTHLLSKS
jgi:hypothetical protein